MVRIIFLSLVCGFLLAGCSNGKMNARVDSLEQQLKEVRSLQAEHTAQIDALEARTRSITGRTEELAYSQSVQQNENLALQRDVSRLRTRVPPPAIVPPEVLENDEVLASGLDPESGRLFGNAFVRIREGNFAEALPVLRELLVLSGGQNWMANVIFWMGICHEGQGTNEKALAAYYDLVRRFPEHDRAPLALLRQAAVFVLLNDKTNATLAYKKLIAKYPKAPEARTARSKLSAL